MLGFPSTILIVSVHNIDGIPHSTNGTQLGRLWVQSLAESYQRLLEWYSVPLWVSLGMKRWIVGKWLSGQGFESCSTLSGRIVAKNRGAFVLPPTAVDQQTKKHKSNESKSHLL